MINSFLKKLFKFWKPYHVLQPLNDGSNTAAYIIGSKETLFGNINTDFSKMPKLSENIDAVLEIVDKLY